MANRTILITGTNGGIGLFVAEYLLQQGLKDLVCHYRSSSDKISALLAKYDLDPQKHLVQADLADEASIAKMRTSIESNGFLVDRLVNVAGSSSNGMSWKLTANEFRKILDDNLTSAFLTSREFLPKMREMGFGRIINFSSIVGFTGVAGAAHYCAAKAGVVGLTKAMALETANKGVTCNAIALGYFNAGLIEDVPAAMQEEIKKKIPVGRLGEMADVGSTVNFLISENSRFITGQVIHLNGGQF